MIEFRRVAVDDLLPQARKYLAEAVRRTPASTDRIDITLEMAKKYGEIYTVYDTQLTGCLYLLTYNTKEGKILSPVLVGGKNLKKWRNELFNFLADELKKVDGVAVRYIGRKGWLKTFPTCRNIGTIYEWKPAFGGSLKAG